MKCPICDRKTTSGGYLCSSCRRSYDKNLEWVGASTMDLIIIWAARRARKFERKEMRRRCSTPEILDRMDKVVGRLKGLLT